jgi:hypothetical protein
LQQVQSPASFLAIKKIAAHAKTPQNYLPFITSRYPPWIRLGIPLRLQPANFLKATQVRLLLGDERALQTMFLFSALALSASDLPDTFFRRCSHLKSHLLKFSTSSARNQAISVAV